MATNWQWCHELWETNLVWEANFVVFAFVFFIIIVYENIVLNPYGYSTAGFLQQDFDFKKVILLRLNSTVNYILIITDV